MRSWRNIVMVGVAMVFLAGPSLAYYDEYDDYSGSHPLRIAAYAIHPIGYSLQWLLFRPVHALVSQPELQPIFGYKPPEWDFTTGLPQVSEVTAPPPAAAAPPVVSTADAEAARRAADEARAAAEEAKHAAEEAARAADKALKGFEKLLRK